MGRNWRREVVRGESHVRAYLGVACVSLDATRLMAHAVPPHSRHLRTAREVASHYDQVRRLLDEVAVHLDAVDELLRTDSRPEQVQRRARVPVGRNSATSAPSG